VILNDENYSSEYNKVANCYGYSSFLNINGKNRVELVTEWSKENSTIINIIILVSKYNIVKFIKDRQDFAMSELLSIEKSIIGREAELSIQ